MRTRIPLNDGWAFTKEFDGEFLRGAKAGEPVELPHTCAVTPFHYFDENAYQMLSGYRRVIDLPEEWADKRVFVRFGAAAHRAEIYANGEKIFTHANGYTAFEVELTPYITPGRPLVLAVSCDSRETLDQPPFGYVIDYMTYGGLYREAFLEVRENTHISDLFVIPEIPEGAGILPGNCTAEDAESISFTGLVRAKMRIDGKNADGMILRVRSADGETILSEKYVGAASEAQISLDGAKLWDALSPALYVLEVSLLRGETVVDTVRERFGFRRAVFTKDGFFLNGRRFQLRGLNRHQSYPYVGYAMPASQQRLDAEVLKNELGANAVRTSHYPQSQHFMNRCDELGLLVFTEIPGWQHIGGDAWKKQAVENVAEMVTQYRNHPSVILWGVRINESQDDDELYTETNKTAHELDPTRQTGGVRYLKKSKLLEDVYTYNDFLHSGNNAGCEKPAKVTSDKNKPYLITEYCGHMFPTKTFDSEAHRLEHALRHAKVLDDAAAIREISGTFGWCMADYNTHKDFGSGDRVCYHGVTDMFRNPKLAAAVYASFKEGEPFLEVSGSMDIGEHPGGYRGKLFAFTNADAVRVYKNDAFIKEYTHKNSPYGHLKNAPIDIDDLIGDQIKAEGFSPKKEALVRNALNTYARCGGKDLPLSFYFKMIAAMLFYRMKYADAYALYGKYLGNWGDRSVVYRFDAVKDGKVVRTVMKTPMTKAHLEALPDRTEIATGESYEVVSVRLRVCDENGNVLPFYTGAARVKIEGPLTVLGPDDFPIAGGTGGGYLRTVGEKGPAKVTLSMPDLDETTAYFTVL